MTNCLLALDFACARVNYFLLIHEKKNLFRAVYIFSNLYLLLPFNTC